MHTIIDDVLASLQNLADSKRVEFAKKSYPTKMKVIGVNNPNLKIILKELKTQTKDFTISEKYSLAKLMVDTEIFESQQLAFEYIGMDKANMKTITESVIDNFFKNMDNWVSVDYFGVLFVGVAWRENIISTDKIKTYLKSNNYWERRIAVVATVALNQKARGGTGNSKRTLEICELVVNDHTDMINKALSWALRELAKIDRPSVLDFINKYQKELNKKVLREVTNKLNFGLKNIKNS
ncbi:MAG: DNA alkylation repair protein [Salinivirgaceae bacterium]|jgi:3-methyladenine DNA glycosylase AlkD|nr:DNA alkylation repair protein [Salinivirgaceae bacterium]